MDDQVKVTTQREGSRVRIRLKFPLPTEPLRRLGADGRTRPPLFLQTVVVERDGAPVFSGHFGPFMARFPEVEFELEGLARGQALALRWQDSAGGEHEQRLVVDA
jgi:hypothetical protein